MRRDPTYAGSHFDQPQPDQAEGPTSDFLLRRLSAGHASARRHPRSASAAHHDSIRSSTSSRLRQTSGRCRWRFTFTPVPNPVRPSAASRPPPTTDRHVLCGDENARRDRPDGLPVFAAGGLHRKRISRSRTSLRATTLANTRRTGNPTRGSPARDSRPVANHNGPAVSRSTSRGGEVVGWCCSFIESVRQELRSGSDRLPVGPARFVGGAASNFRPPFRPLLAPELVLQCCC